ncbi:MAG TPA: hypothetical protein VFB25_07355 [Gaiellaceae bacterium]|nr:hypothetical protein [Gaiellaceae bacterium]
MHDNLGTIVGAGIDTYWLRELPSTIAVVVAVRLLATHEELDPEVAHSAINRVRDTRGDLVSEVGGEFRMEGSEGARQDWLTGIILSSVVQLEVAEEGSYTVEHEVDGNVKAFPIHVVNAPPPGQEWPDEDEEA